MIKTRGALLRSALVALITVALLVPATAGAESSFLERFICTASGSITTTAQPETWTIVGGGSCASQYNPYFLSFTGSGTSKGLGLCSNDGLPFIVQDLDLLITGTLTSSDPFDPTVKQILQYWYAPATTYPLGTPFWVAPYFGVKSRIEGAGVFWNHIFLDCQGTPVATFQWEYGGRPASV